MKIALVCAGGIGDGLLMKIIHHHLEKKGYEVTFFHSKHPLLSPLFPKAHYAFIPPKEEFFNVFSNYDQILLQNDHSEHAWELFRLRECNKLPQVRVVFITPYPAQMRENDYLIDPSLSIADNFKILCQNFYRIEDASTENGLIPQKRLNDRKKANKVMIHPTSKDFKRNWTKKKFIELSFFLKKLGYEPHFCVSKEEEKLWEDMPIYGIKLHATEDLLNFAHILTEFDYFIGNDSGMGHLASNLKLPTLTISGNKKRVHRWRPGWHVNQIVTTSLPLPNFKGLVFPFFDGRIRDNYWQYFISVGKVLKGFKTLAKTTQTLDKSS